MLDRRWVVYRERVWNEKRLAADTGGGWMLAVAYESNVSEGVQVKWLCFILLENDLVV
jgi:hypothetical protein